MDHHSVKISPSAERDLSTCTGRMAPPTGLNDASDIGASLDAVAFDSSLSFLENMDPLSESVMALLDSAPTASPETDSSVSSSPNTDTSDVASGDVDGGSGGDDSQQRGVTAKDSESPKSARRATTSRERQREELVYLREKVMELESELAQLQAEGVGLPVVPSTWEKVAKRQKEAKLVAEAENVKLRELLVGQLRVARSLEKLLKRRSLSESADHFSKRSRLYKAQETTPNAKRAEVRSRIMSLLDDVDTVMYESGLSNISTDMEDVHVTTSASTDGIVCMELVEVRVLPFPVEEVAEAVWNVTSGTHIELSNGHFSASRLSEFMSDVRFTVEIRVRRVTVLLDVSGVSARRVELERSKIVFDSAGTTQGTLFEDNPIYCRERGFLLIEKNASTNNDASPSTIVKVCVRLWPEGIRGKCDNDHHYVPFIDVLVGSYNQNVKLVLQLVESALLEQTV